MKFAKAPYRMTPLPISNIKGKFYICENVIDKTKDLLTQFIRTGMDSNGNEGIVFWGGFKFEDKTIITTAISPIAESSFARVMVSSKNFGIASREFRKNGICFLSQVHSHPGECSYHSDGDDKLILFPHEGMLSLVASNFGNDIKGITDFSIHQFQQGKWVLCNDESLSNAIQILPLGYSMEDL